jgi:hypothetical protein
MPQVARPAPSDGDVLALTLDAVLSCAAQLIVKSLRRCPAEAHGFCSVPAAAPALSAVTTARRLAETVSRKLGRWLERLARGGERWSVAWRYDTGQSLLHQHSASFAVLPDDGSRYYADPFPFQRDGRTFIFVEEFCLSSGRGRISVTEIDGDGRPSVPRPVLEEPHHLSYPFVFAHEGDVWMIPEAGESGRVSLYRAAEFPYKWRHEAVLIDGIAAYDATLLRHHKHFWLFVCERIWHSSSWDILNLFHADQLTGKWTPHERNPVLCDALLSRPAGATFTFNGKTVRPVQDCSERYGGSINLCSLDQLDEATFHQTMLGRIDCGAEGCHTYNYAAGLEVIDVFGPSRRGGTVTARFTPVSSPPTRVTPS